MTLEHGNARLGVVEMSWGGNSGSEYYIFLDMVRPIRGRATGTGMFDKLDFTLCAVASSNKQRRSQHMIRKFDRIGLASMDKLKEERNVGDCKITRRVNEAEGLPWGLSRIGPGAGLNKVFGRVPEGIGFSRI